MVEDYKQIEGSTLFLSVSLFPFPTLPHFLFLFLPPTLLLLSAQSSVWTDGWTQLQCSGKQTGLLILISLQLAS